MNVGSLFAGIGGFDVGFERAGMRTLWQVEIDPFCRRVLERHFPDAERYEDVREVGAHNLAPVDVLCGGFPCQDLSVAGKGAGIEGSRSGLWAEYARIIGELRPRYVVVENVPALLTRGFERVLGDLAALGYDAEWDCLPASAFGAPHRRDRVWVVAYSSGEPGRLAEPGHRGQGREPSDSCEPALVRQGDGSNGAEGVEPRHRTGDVGYPNGTGLEGRGGHDERPGEWFARSAGSEMADAEGERFEAGSGAGDTVGAGEFAAVELEGCPALSAEGCRPTDYWLVEPDVGRVAHGIPSRVDRLSALGNALVPQIAEWIGRRLMDA